MVVVIKWSDFCFQEDVYSLAHLETMEHEYVQEAKGEKGAKSYKPERVYRFWIEFGLHCFTKGPSAHKGKVLADYPEELWYSDSRETRIFSFERYKWSLMLPNIAKGISRSPCYHTGKGNFFVISIDQKQGNREEYEVYFKVTRTGQKGRLRLFIESAYIRDPEHKSAQPKKNKINFFVIANNIQAKKNIRM
tara:strand:- start:379 stop:954 length:576 start_codon:yes stop_codon:yes gene_type:complete